MLCYYVFISGLFSFMRPLERNNHRVCVQVVRSNHPRTLRRNLRLPGRPPPDQRYAWAHRRDKWYSRICRSRWSLDRLPKYQFERSHAVWHRRYRWHGIEWHLQRCHLARNGTRHRNRVSAWNTVVSYATSSTFELNRHQILLQLREACMYDSEISVCWFQVFGETVYFAGWTKDSSGVFYKRWRWACDN